MSQQKALLKDPVGYQDWTLPVTIVGQVIEQLKVDIAAQTLANLKVDIAAQSLAELNVKLVASEVTLNVAITSSSVTLDVNIVSQAVTLNVAIQSSAVTLDVNIASQAVTLNVAIQSSDVTLDVNVTNASLTVNIGAPLSESGYVQTSIVESVQLDVNIAASAVTLNVAIQSSAVTLDVAITSCAVTLDVNIVSQAATLKVSIESCMATLDVNIASSAVTLNVAIKSSDVTLDVNVTNASLTVNIGAPLTDTGYLASSIVESVQLDVNIAASAVTLNVAITSSSVTLDVNVTNASLTVNIGDPLTDTGYVATSVVESVQLDVNIAAQAVTLNVAITSSSVTLDVNVTNASLTVNIGGPLTTSGYVASEIVKSVQLDVNIAASAVTLNVAITSSSVTLDVNVTNASLTVNIGGPLTTDGYVASEIVKSVQLDVNIAASAVTLNVAIKSSDVTIDVNVTNASLTVNIGGPLTDTGYVQTSIMESVQLDVNIAASAVTLNVAIKSSDITLNVNVTNASLTVNIGGPVDANGYVQTHIMDSVQLDVNIAASAVTLNVAIQSSAVTLDVNIASSAVTLDINVTNPVLQVGQTKPALAFDGVDDYVEVPDSPSLRPTNFTVCFWMKGIKKADYQRIMGKALFATDKRGWVVLWSGGYSIYMVAFDEASTEKKIGAFVPITENEWTFVAFVKDGDVGKSYKNGSLLGTTDLTGWTFAPSTEPLRVGKAYTESYYSGIISLVCIYNRALSDSEIQQLYQNPQAPPTNGLVLWLNFDEGSGTTAHDRSGNGNHGTIYGATWVSEAGEVPALVNVNLSAQTVTLEVKIVASDVTLNVAIQSSAVTLDVNITGSSVTLDVNIASSSATLNVQITGSTVTLDVNVVGTANVNITDAIVNISALKLMDTGTVMVKDGFATGTVTLYTVPTGKKAYIYHAHLALVSISSTEEGTGELQVYDGTSASNLMTLFVNPDHPYASECEAFTLLSLPEGWEIRLHANDYAIAYASVIIVEVSA